MKHVPINEAEGQLEALAKEVLAGERIVLTANGEPMVELTPPPKRQRGLDLEGYARWLKANRLKPLLTEIPNDFDDALPEDFLISPER